MLTTKIIYVGIFLFPISHRIQMMRKQRGHLEHQPTVLKKVNLNKLFLPKLFIPLPLLQRSLVPQSLLTLLSCHSLFSGRFSNSRNSLHIFSVFLPLISRRCLRLGFPISQFYCNLPLLSTAPRVKFVLKSFRCTHSQQYISALN